MFTEIHSVHVGSLLTVQAAVNGHLSTISKSSIFASLVSYLGGVPGLLIVWLATSNGGSDINYSDVKEVEWWSWFGGVLGASYLVNDN